MSVSRHQLGRQVGRTYDHRTAAALPSSILRIVVAGQLYGISFLEPDMAPRVPPRLDRRRGPLFW